MRARPTAIRVRRLGITCAAAAESLTPQQCTYGASNVLWVASELKRLLTMQVILSSPRAFDLQPNAAQIIEIVLATLKP